MKEEKKIEIKIGMQLLYTGRKINVKEVNRTHVLVSFDDTGTNVALDKFGFTNEDIITNKN